VTTPIERWLIDTNVWIFGLRRDEKFPDCAELSWERVPSERVVFYKDRGCRKGDAIIAAYAETLNADLIVSNNRQFLQTVANLPAEIVTPAQALSRLRSTNAE